MTPESRFNSAASMRTPARSMRASTAASGNSMDA